MITIKIFGVNVRVILKFQTNTLQSEIQIEVHKSIILGRSSLSNHIIDDALMSGAHCKISVSPSKLEITDFNAEHRELPKIFFATTSPMESIAKIFTLKEDYIRIREINWSLIEEGSIDIPQTKIQLYMDFYNLDNKDLFGDISRFIKKTEESFINYDVFYTRESNGMVTSANSYKVPIIISIIGPRKGK